STPPETVRIANAGSCCESGFPSSGPAVCLILWRTCGGLAAPCSDWWSDCAVLAGKGRRILQHAEIFSAMHQEVFSRGAHAWLHTAAEWQLLHSALAEGHRRLVPRQGGDPAHSCLL